ncbi:MAG: HAMP domain-containing protein, partial [Candidatus Binatia bacterium]|nr:HAMP domain-containing protein [Candidatus Binatia bacterium]
MEQDQRDLVSEEQRRRQRWEGVIILAAALGVFLFAFLQNRPPQISDSDSFVSNIVFVLLINLNIILLVLLVFLVGRNLIKLFYERRRKLLGSHLRFRLVLAFVAISLFPAILLFLIGVGFLTKSVENWFAMQIEGALEGSLEVTGAFYDHLADEALFYARDLAVELSGDGLLEGRTRRAVQELIATKRRVLNVGRIAVVSRDGELLAVATAPDVRAGEESGQDAAFLERVWQNEEVRFIRSVAGMEVVCGAVPLDSRGYVVGAVIVGFFVPQNVARRSTQLINAFREYRHLKVLKQPIKNNYLITMSLVTLVVVFSAVWVGLFMAKKITVPLQRLAEGTREVAQRHWAHRIAGEGEDEIGTLVAAFNRMTAELQQSHQELEARRRYMEILLANINAGVVSLDRSGVVTTVNRAAERLLGMVAAAAVARDYREVFAPGEFAEVRRIVRDLLPVHPREAEEGVQESQGQLRLTREGQTYSLL